MKLERIDNTQEEIIEPKPIEFTHYLNIQNGWDENALREPNEFDRLVYLGNCSEDGDMFVAYGSNCINVYKGHLNDGIIAE